jgi:HAD superfamily hydrolase (TIGR01509 family)
MRVAAVAFDVDGTLVDSNALHAEAWHRVLARHGFTVPYAEVARHIGMGGDQLVPALIGRPGEEKQARQLRAEAPAEFGRLASQRGIEPFPGAREVLELLRARGVPFAVATSGRSRDLELVVQVSRFDFRAGAAAVISGDDVEQSKPDPELIQRAIEALRVRPRDCAFVGDTPFDAAAAVRAGARAIGVLQGVHSEKSLREAGAVFVYQDMRMLAEALPRLLHEWTTVSASSPA